MGALTDRIALGKEAWLKSDRKAITRTIRDSKGYLVQQHSVDNGVTWFTPID